jgi:hypothetical protein
MALKLAIANTIGVKVEGNTTDENGDHKPFRFILVCEPPPERGGDEARSMTAAKTTVDFLKKYATRLEGTAAGAGRGREAGGLQRCRARCAAADRRHGEHLLPGLPAPGGGDGKKLEEAVELWADGRFTNEQDDAANQAAVDADAAVFGMAIVRAPQPPEIFALWPENVRTWGIWMSVQSQWRTSMAGREGLDYAGVDSELRHGLHRVRPKDFRRVRAEIQIMERVALRTWAAAARKRR